MKILHLGYSDTKGGAAISMMRLHKSLIEQNIDSKVLVAEKISNDPNVIGPTKSFEVLLSEIKKIIVRQKKIIFKSNNSFSHSLNFFSSNIIKKINEINPDIVNLHWVNNELLSIGQIGQIKQPIVWTFVDMWPMCGGEHYTETLRYKNGYFKNNKEFQQKWIDLNRLLWLRKKKKWKSKIKEVVCISDWLKDKALESDLFRNVNIKKINCNIDLNIWKPIEKNIAKNILDLPTNKKLFLFVSTNGITDRRKGFMFIDSALKKLSKERNDFELIIVGKAANIGKKDYNYRVIDRIFDGNPVELRLIYSSCDLVLTPSTHEAFGQVALEAASCGIPSIGFKETGIVDIIQHKINGYLSNYLDQYDFDSGIKWILNSNDNEYKSISKNCLQIVNERFANSYIAKKYIELYKSIN